ncbi:MAG: dipeptidase [Acidobacteria bacterium]|nr:dipeptidase [Acidobacteriota bacterium]
MQPFRSNTALLLLFVLFTSQQLAAQDHIGTAKRILREVPLIDGHNDLPWELHQQVRGQLTEIDLRSNTSMREKPMHTDIPRLRAGGLGAQFWSVYVPMRIAGPQAVKTVLEQIDLVERFTRQYDDTFEMAYTADDIVRIHRAGRIASLIGAEGGHSIDNSLAILRQLYDAGTRYMTLTHSDNTVWVDSATDDPQHGGLAPFGEEIVREMVRLGMLVDLSHTSPDAMHDVLDLTPAPVIFSHSSARALTGHPRNVPDDVLRRLKDNGGIVMVTFVTVFVSEERRVWSAEQGAEKKRLEALHPGDPDARQRALEEWERQNLRPEATLEQVADHIDHVRDVAGIDHIGIGSDFDGISTTPVGLGDVSTFPALFAELLERGYSEADLKKIAGLNFLRVMLQAEQISAELRLTIAPSEVLFEELADDTPIPR